MTHNRSGGLGFGFLLAISMGCADQTPPWIPAPIRKNPPTGSLSPTRMDRTSGAW
jgi:hypothetical protein